MRRKALIALAFMVCAAGFLSFRLAARAAQGSQQTQMDHDLEKRREKEANKKRQDDIREDTQKLYQLASELKDAVDKSNENVLSLNVVKKAEEVEKLAKKVKEMMREGIGKPIVIEPPPPPRPPYGPG